MDLSHQLYSLNLNHYMDSVLQHQLFFQVLLYVMIIKDILSTLFYYDFVGIKSLRKKNDTCFSYSQMLKSLSVFAWP